MSLPISRLTAICYWLLPIIAHQNNTTLLGTKIKAAVHVCATHVSIKASLHTDTCDLKETVENVMNLSRQMRTQCAALQYHNALEVWITTDTTGRSEWSLISFVGLLLLCLLPHVHTYSPVIGVIAHSDVRILTHTHTHTSIYDARPQM